MTPHTFLTVARVRAALAATVQASMPELEAAIGRIAIVLADQFGSKPAPAVRSTFDAGTRTTVLLADRIPFGGEEQAVLEELLRWHGLGALPAGWHDARTSEVLAWFEAEAGTVEKMIYGAVTGPDVRADQLLGTAVDAAVTLGVEPSQMAPLGSVGAWLYHVGQGVRLAAAQTVGHDVADVSGRSVVGLVSALAAGRGSRYRDSLDITSRPLAAQGLDSYRCKAGSGWIMIGAKDDADAMREARRSSSDVHERDLQKWDGKAYVPCTQPGPMVDAAGFHSMRGHVAEGTNVRFASGEVLTVRSAMVGWKLVSQDGSLSLGPYDGAMALTEAIVQRDAHPPAKVTAFEEARNQADILNLRLTAASDRVNAIADFHGRGAMGLTPDHVRAMPEYKIAKADLDQAFGELRKFNSRYVKTFANELRTERDLKRGGALKSEVLSQGEFNTRLHSALVNAWARFDGRCTINSVRAKFQRLAVAVPDDSAAQKGDLLVALSDGWQYIHGFTGRDSDLKDECTLFLRGQISVQKPAFVPKKTRTNTVYQATEEDVANVLSSNELAIPNGDGRSFDALAQEVMGNLDFEEIENAALYGDGLDQQTDYANDEITRQLRVLGVLQPLREPAPAPAMVDDGPAP